MTIEDAAELRLQPAARRPARGAPAEPRGPRGGDDPAARAQRAADASRPDRRRRGPRRRRRSTCSTALSTGHDGSLQHRPRRLAGRGAAPRRDARADGRTSDCRTPRCASRSPTPSTSSSARPGQPDGTRRVVAVAEVVRVAGGPAAREIYSWRRGRGHWRAALSEGLAARLAAAGSADAGSLPHLAAGESDGSVSSRGPRGPRSMTRTAVLSFGAGVAGVLGVWEALAAVERSRAVAALEQALEPLVRAAHEGRAPTGPERRRLALLATGALAAAGWLVGGVALGALAAILGPALVVAAVRTRRRHYARAVGRGAAAAARTLGRRRGGRTLDPRRDRRRLRRARRPGRPRAPAPPPARSRSASRRPTRSSRSAAAPPTPRGTRSWPGSSCSETREATS